MLISTILNVCIVSHLKRCYVSFHELIVSCSIFEEISSVEFFSIVIVVDEDLESKDVKINWSNESTSLRRAVGSRRL